jgi:hypothetical protein
MALVVQVIDVHWSPIKITGMWEQECLEVQSKLDAELKSWLGTPYAIGQQCKGVGVDCVRFVGAILDFMAGSVTPLDMLPPDVAFHDSEKARGALDKFRDLFRPMEIVRDWCVEPGDVVVVGPRSGGPGHGIIVGCRPGVTYEAGSFAVNQTGLALSSKYRAFGVFRKGDRGRWLRPTTAS